LLGVLHGACALAGEILVTSRLLLREHQRGLRLLHLGLAGVDLRPLHRDLRVNILDAGLRGVDLGARLLERDAVVAVIDKGNYGPGYDVLVVGHRHLRDVARHFRRDGDLARRDESIVGRFETGSVAPVDEASGYRQRKQNRTDRSRDRVPAPETVASLSDARVLRRGLFGGLSGQFRALRLAGRGFLARRGLGFNLAFPARKNGDGIVRRSIRRARNELPAFNFVEHSLVIAL